MEIVPGVHRIASVYNGRWLYQHVIVANDRVALIDTGISETPEKVIFPYLKEIGLSPEQIDIVITTHCDADHCGGNETVRRVAPHALFVSQMKEASLLASTDRIMAERYGEFVQYGLPQQPEDKRAGLKGRLGRGIPSDIAFEQELKLRFPLAKQIGNEVSQAGDEALTLRLLYTPGHTAGHLVVHIPERSVVIIADALLGTGVPDTEGNMVLPPTYRFADDYVQTIEMMRQLDADYYLPTHFHTIRGGEAWEEFCDSSLNYVYKVEAFILNVLSVSKTASLLDFIQAANDQPLGEWPEALNQELTYCLLGGLERLERQNKIERQGILWNLEGVQ